MSAPGHTPGDWSWDMHEDGSATLYATHDGDVFEIADFWRKPLRRAPQDTRFDSELKAEQIANLNLAAAAPRLLAALANLIPSARHYGGIRDCDVKAIEAADAAIAQATNAAKGPAA